MAVTVKVIACADTEFSHFAEVDAATGAMQRAE